MEFRMAINRLSQDELSYELSIRGVSGLEGMELKRKTLRSLLKLEKTNPSLSCQQYPFTYAEDVAAITSTIEEVRTLVSEFDDTTSSSAYLKISTKVAHGFARADRVKAVGTEQMNGRSSLIVTLISLWSEVKCKVKAHLRSSSLRSQAVLELNTSSNQADELLSESDSEPDVPSVSIAQPAQRAVVKTILPAQWNLKFSGEPKDMSLSAFLERVSELRVARNVGKTQLFASSIDLFRGKALTWFRANRHSITDWDSLVDSLRVVFHPPDYDDRLFDEIKSRTQGPDESLDVFVAIVESMFQRMSTRVIEDTKLKILLRNIDPYLQHHLGLTEVESINHLLKLGRRLEHRRVSINNFTPPSRNARTLEPDLAYVESSPSARSVPSTSSRVSQVTCWNCGEKGHRSLGCPKVKRKHCFKCGKPGVIVSTCPTCSSGNGRSRP